MSKKKLTDAQIIEIAIAYANNKDSVTQSKFSEKYKVSESTISKYLHLAISNFLINETTANLIAQKAIRNEDKRRKELGLAPTNKTTILYKGLLIKHKKKRIEKELNENYEQIELNLINYDELYSQNDEYPYTKEELEKQLDLAKRKILEYKNNNEI